jgi:hypothetical protein
VYAPTTGRAGRADDRPQRLLERAAGEIGQGPAHHDRALVVGQQLTHVVIGQHK